jgi:hypothetical protein
MHAENPKRLENEPKFIDPVNLTEFRGNARKVRDTILGFNGILWANDGVYANPGEEVMDIGVDDHNRESNTDAAGGPNEHITAVPDSADAAGSVHVTPGYDQSQRHVENTGGNLWNGQFGQYNHDNFNTFLYPEMLDEFDFGHFDAASMSLDFFDVDSAPVEHWENA